MEDEWTRDGDQGRESVWFVRGRLRTASALLLALGGPSAATFAILASVVGRFQSLGYVAAVVLAALVGRLSAGLVSVLASGVLIVYFVFPPGGLSLPTTRDSTALAWLLGFCVFLAALVSALQRTRSAALGALHAARRAEQRLTVLAQASAAMVGSFDLKDSSSRVCELVVRSAWWDHCAVILDHSPQPAEVVATASVAPRTRKRWWRRRSSVEARAATSPLPTGLHSLQVLRPDGQLHGIGPWFWRSGLLMPLLVDGRSAGSLVLLHVARGRPYGPGAMAFATELASRLSGVIDAERRYAAESEIAQTLQRNLLPRELPDVPGLDVHAAYHAGGRTVAGGDFYDLFPVDDGRWMVVVGDVCGKGPEAASVMGIARASMRAIALREHSPAQVMGLVNEALLAQVADDRFVSACAAVLEPLPDGTVVVTMCRAGHPPPVLRQADGAVGLVGIAGGPVLGIMPGVELCEDKFVLSRDDRLVLYTDGVERPGDPADDVALRLVTQCGAERSEVVTDRFADAMRSTPAGKADDLAVMVLTVAG